MKCNSYHFVFQNDNILVEQTADGIWQIPFGEKLEGIEACSDMISIPSKNGGKAIAYQIDGCENTGHYHLYPLRQSYYILDKETYMLAGKCREMLYWNENTKFCGACGGKMEWASDISKRCRNCNKEIWPQIAPAIIVLIRKGDKALLAKSRNFKRDFYSLIAGFVETGESLEDAVKREVMEETGLTIKDIRYFDSQPWPYPNSLMVGFTANYHSGDIILQKEELLDAQWFDASHLPNLPEKLSIARRLIDSWLDDGNRQKEAEAGQESYGL